MDTGKKSDKSQSNGSERGNSHSSHSRQGQRSKNKPNRMKRPAEKRHRENGDFNEHAANEKRYNQRQEYRNDRSRSNKGYHPDEYNHNNSRHNKRQWNQNSRHGRSRKWNNSGTRYGNRTWKRCEALPFDEVFPNELNYCDTNFASDEPFLTPNESFYQQRDLDTQQIHSSSNEKFTEEGNVQEDQFETSVQALDKEKQGDHTQTRSSSDSPNKRGRKDRRNFENRSQPNPRNVKPKETTQEISKDPSSPPKTNPEVPPEKKGKSSPPKEKDQVPEDKTNTEVSIPKDTEKDIPQNPQETEKNTPSEQGTEPENVPLELAEFGSLEKVFIKQEPGLEITDTLLTSIKEEPLDNTDLDLELATCLNYETENHFPSISVIPISELIKSELKDIGRNDIVAQSPPTRSRLTLRPNLVQRRKVSINEDNSENLSENLVKRVANMDKVGIKNVINNSGTKYDAALKIQARKRLREEIRKQLKSVNFPSPDSSQNSGLVPDEIVDSMNIPAVILDEIRKAFGIVLVEDMKVIPEAKTDDPPQADPPTATDTPSKSPDLKSRLKMLEELKSQTGKPSGAQRAAPSPRKDPKGKSKDEVVVINSSSSSSSSSSSGSDSDSSSSSSDSNESTTSSFKRRRRKKRILEDNVVGNFEKLILPNLTQSQRRRYREKYSKATKSSLQYIYGVCVSRAHPNDIKLDAKEKLKLKRNLSSSDNTQALEVLMKAILNLFERQKEKRRLNRDKSTASGSKSRSKSELSNPVNRTKKPNDSSRNQGDSENELASREDSETASTARSVELPKHQSTRVNKAPVPPLTPSTVVGGVNRNDEDSIRESAKSAQGDMLADGGLVARESDSESDLDNLPSSENLPPMSRLWKSPGEKKCIELETPLSLSGLGSLQSPFGMHSMDLDALTSQRTIGDEAVRNIREIDVKLMELHKRKMYIEEMILKLHKDKMEVDLWTMKLQNEKFILLNSALAGAGSSTSALLPPKTEKKSAPKRKPLSTPFSEKLRSRKKRCTDQETISDPSQQMQQPRQTRSEVKCKREETSTSEANKTETPADPGEVAAAEKNDDPPPAAVLPLIQTDYTDVGNGSLEGWKLPITQIIVVGEAIVAASEDGNIYKFNIRTRELESKFSKHTEAITQIFICPRENFVYTTSLDGFLKKTSVENFGLEIHSLNLQEPLQSIDIEWSTAFIGSRWGNIFTYSIKSNSLSESLLCSSGSSIIALKATKEGPRKVLIVSSKGNQINFRDAMSGLLLRSLDVSDNLHIYSILLDDGCIFCGTQRNEIHKYNFTTGGRLAVFQCGNGAVSMKMYKDKYIFVGCYDGFVYVLDKTTGCQIGRFPGSGKMILALEIAGDKLITSAKDNSMQIIDIPKYIVTKDKS